MATTPELSVTEVSFLKLLNISGVTMVPEPPIVRLRRVCLMVALLDVPKGVCKEKFLPM